MANPKSPWNIATASPYRVDCVVISTQHSDKVSNEDLRDAIMEHVIKPIVPATMLDAKNEISHQSQPAASSSADPWATPGLTGRKIIVDTYGGYSRHGGGAFSGKDPSKVDRSACYMARYIAKNIVAAGLAQSAEVQLAYAIGVAEPVSVMVDTFGTAAIPEEKITELVRQNFSLTPQGNHRDPGPAPPDLPAHRRLRPLRPQRRELHLGKHRSGRSLAQGRRPWRRRGSGRP